MDELIHRLKEYLEENPLKFSEEQKQKIVMDVVNPRDGVVCDEYVEFKLWMRGLKSRQEYFADYVEQHLPPDRYRRLLEVGCGKTARLSVLLAKRGYQMTAMDPGVEPETVWDSFEGVLCRPEPFYYETTELSCYDAVIAQEPCETTEHIIRACLTAGKPCLISLCGTPHTLISGEEPENLQEWHSYLEGLMAGRGTIKRQELIPGFICFVAEIGC